MRADLLKFSDRRIPRYTSYPTAMQFNAAVDGSSYAEWLSALPADVSVSIYLHVPFCAELCLYCGCNTTVVRKYTPVAAYTDLLEREIALVGRHLGDRRPVRHVHWGGGTPTMLLPRDFARLTDALRQTFSIAITTTSPSCPFSEVLLQRINNILRLRFREAASIRVRLVLNPPWTLERLSENARANLGWARATTISPPPFWSN